MTLLEKLKRALGLDPGDEGGTDTALTVEREAGEAAGTDGAVRAGDVGEAAGTDTEAAASTGSMVESHPDDSPAGAAEPAEAAGSESDDRTVEGDAATDVEVAEAEPAGESEPEPEPESESEPEPEPAEADADPVEELTGIGPAYGERLRGIGIETVADLAAADAADIAAETDIGEGRASTWIDRARDR